MSLALIATGAAAQQISGSSTTPNATFADANTPIKHIVIIMQENHSFDNYFGTFPNLQSQYAVDQKVCVPLDLKNPSQGCVHPWNADSQWQKIVTVDLPHTQGGSLTSIDGGKMDGFVYSALSAKATNGTTENYPMAYFTGATLPDYWDYAQYYSLDANFFSSIKAPSYPNHLYLVSAQSGGITTNQPVFNLTFDNIASIMTNSNVDWKYYSGGWNNKINCVSPLTSHFLDSINYPLLYRVWNVLIDFPAIQQNKISCHNLGGIPQLFTDVSNGNLPQVSWVIPGGTYASEHACNGSPQCGPILTQAQEYVSSVISAIESDETLYSSTAIFITWDDFGGYYDHVTPKTVDKYGYSFRVPLIVISPYVKHGISYGVNGQPTDFTSFLKTIESNWKLPGMTTRDANASSLMGMFDFNQTPSPALFMPSGKLASFPVSSCVSSGLCDIGKGNVPISTLASAIPKSAAPNDED